MLFRIIQQKYIRLKNCPQADYCLLKASEILENLAPDYRYGNILDYSFHQVIKNLFITEKHELALRMLEIFRNVLDKRRINSTKKNIRRIMASYANLVSSIPAEYGELKIELYDFIIDEYTNSIEITNDVSLYDELMKIYMDLAAFYHNHDGNKEIEIYVNCIATLENLAKDYDFAFISKHLEQFNYTLGKRLSLNGMKTEGLCYILKAYDVCEREDTRTQDINLEKYTHQVLRALKKIDTSEIDEEYLPMLNRILERSTDCNSNT